MLTPDSFDRDPYGWLTNQVSHIALGALMALALSVFGFAVFGEFPVRTHMLAAIFVLYFVVIELVVQGWRGFDTIEDTIFTVGYGAAGPLAVSSEIVPGRMAIVMELEPLLPFVYMSAAHLIGGIVWRSRP